MRKVFLIATIISIAMLSIFTYIKIVSGNVNDSSEETVSLEDSIIIRSIEMESEEPMSDSAEDGEGAIIYDDTFDAAFADTIPNERNSKINGNADDNNRQLSKMQQKDGRWHLVRYKIRRNDNLWTIARRFNINHRVIIHINNISNPDRLLPGKYLQIPTKNGIFHKIRRGDTLSAIAYRYKVTIDKIKNQNKIPGDRLIAGNKIFIPDARIPKVRNKNHIARRKRGKSSASSRRLALQWPIRGRITSGFGRRRDPFSGKRKFHCGIDISANVGSPVRSAMAGRVIYSGWKGGYGKVVVIRHRRGYITVYAHNSKNLVKVNDTVRKGKLIAYSGNTGAVTGAHLHFELRKYLTPLNPMRFIR